MGLSGLATESDGDAPMMKHGGLVCGLLMAAGPFAHAQVTTTAGTELRRVSQILGSTVQLQGGNNFGKVEDIILSDSGGIGYLVVSANGKYAMLPWNAGNVNYAQRVVTYDVTPQAIQPLYFERDAYPNVSVPQFTTRMQQAFPSGGAVRSISPGGPVVEEKDKVKVRPNGTVIIKEKEKVRDR